MTIETTHLRLIPCDTEILKAAIQGNAILAQKINVTVPDNWTEFGIGPLQYALVKLTESEEEKTGGPTFLFTSKTTNLLAVVVTKVRRHQMEQLNSDMKSLRIIAIEGLPLK